MEKNGKPTTEKPRQQRQQPEKKISLAGGIGVAIWLNTAEADEGQRQFRSITIAPRRYQDRESGEWRDAKSFNAGDLPALIFALTKAQEFCFEQPIPGADSMSDDSSSHETPF